MEGQQADLRVPTEGDWGLEGSQVNLALGQLEDDYGANDRADMHHHDDIVEHLDVIGVSCCNMSSFPSPLKHAGVDPQISTISTLTNAANAIVMCVLTPTLTYIGFTNVSPDPHCHFILENLLLYYQNCAREGRQLKTWKRQVFRRTNTLVKTR